MAVRIFSLFLLFLSLLAGRAASFSATPPPPRPPAGGSGHASDDEQQPQQQTEKRLRNPTKKESIAFTARIKKSRSAKDAIRVILDIEGTSGCVPDVFQYSAAISKCAKERQVKAALSLLKRMVNQGVKPDAVVFGSVISACEKGGEADIALSLLAEMKAEGIRPTVITYSSTISACEKGGAKYTDVALSLLAEMKAEGIRPNDYSYNSAITSCEKGGAKYADTALSLFNEMKGAGVKPDGVTYTTITKACFDSTRYFEALVKVREAADLGKRVNGRSMCIDMSTENDQAKWNLIDLTEAIACMLLSDALLSVTTGNVGPAPTFQDIIVDTGKGQVLREKVPAFLNEVAGLEITAIEGNEGRFLMEAASLEKWVASENHKKFQSLFRE